MSNETFAEYEAKCATAARLRAETLPHNKRVLFDSLAAAGIALVTVAFDGSGDSGQIEGVVAFDADNNEIELPDRVIEIETVEFEAASVTRRGTSVREYLCDLTYDLLGETHCGWETNEGAYGEFRFGVVEGTIRLEYYERYVEATYSERNF